jgi:hypothetical protein
MHLTLSILGIILRGHQTQTVTFLGVDWLKCIETSNVLDCKRPQHLTEYLHAANTDILNCWIKLSTMFKISAICLKNV